MSIRALLLSGLLVALPPAGPALAQSDYTPPLAEDEAPGDDGLSQIERGFGMIMQDLLDEIGPDLNRLGEDMSSALSRMSPVMQDLSALVDDLSNYQTPERLENGDIVIRRKPGAPPPPALGEGLRGFPAPEDDAPMVPRDPYAPEIEL